MGPSSSSFKALITKYSLGNIFLPSRCILGYSLVIIQPLVKHSLFRQFITIQNKCRLNTAHVREMCKWMNTHHEAANSLLFRKKKLFFILQKLQNYKNYLLSSNWSTKSARLSTILSGRTVAWFSSLARNFPVFTSTPCRGKFSFV